MSNDFSGVQLLLTGNEIMSGDTIDSNSAMIAQRLSELAISVHRKVTVGDDQGLLVRELSPMTEAAELVIVNGGLGPTVDDLTAEILAEVAGVAVVEHPGALAHLQSWCGQRNLPLNDANYKQALLPEGCSLIDNPIGSAVGFEMTINGCRVLCTPGVPSELRAMLDWIVGDLGAALDRPSERNILRLQTFGLGESSAQQLIADHLDNWPDDVDLGFRAGAPQMEIKLTIDDASAAAQQRDCRLKLEALFGDHIIGEGDAQLAQVVLELLKQRNQTLATAESCTGGLIASMLTRIPGSSAGFHAGLVTYSNEMKTSLLGVDANLLTEHGAVSEPVVIAMAEGALARANANYAIAVSGIAGPDGGTPEKPVGTVWLAWGSPGSIRTRCLCWPVERSLFQTMIAAAGLDMIRRTLLGIDDEPRYFSQRSAKGSAR